MQVNIEIRKLKAGAQALYFFPDRILVYQGEQIGAVPYSELSIKTRAIQFIESDYVPSDSLTLGYTWQYVNKRGGPDRRFANNRQIPIAEYAELTFTSTTGMNLFLHCSNVAAANQFTDAMMHYRDLLASTSVPNVTENNKVSEETSGEELAGSWIGKNGWVAAPVLLAGMILGLLLVPHNPLARYVVSTQNDVHFNEEKLPTFHVLKQTKNATVLSIESECTDSDLRRLLLDLRQRIKGGTLSQVGIDIPSKPSNSSRNVHSSGTILVFRNGARHGFTVAESDAAVTWNARGQSGTIRTATGKRDLVFRD